MPAIQEQPDQEDSSLKRPSLSQDNQLSQSQSQHEHKQRYVKIKQVLVNKMPPSQAKERPI
jgi:hypothetical protein